MFPALLSQAACVSNCKMGIPLLPFNDIYDFLFFFYCFLQHMGWGATCVQVKSFVACDNARVNATCPSGSNRCVKSELTAGKLSGKEKKSYSKSCSTDALCDNKDSICKVAAAVLGLTDYDCDVQCCEGDLCNGGKVPLVSFIVLSACAIAAFIRWL